MLRRHKPPQLFSDGVKPSPKGSRRSRNPCIQSGLDVKKSSFAALVLVFVKPSPKGSRRSRNPCIQSGLDVKKSSFAALVLVFVKLFPKGSRRSRNPRIQLGLDIKKAALLRSFWSLLSPPQGLRRSRNPHQFLVKLPLSVPSIVMGPWTMPPRVLISPPP